LEDELDSGLETDLETLLAHSAEDRDSFENFRLLKAWVKDSDPLAELDIETRLRRVHARVMAEVMKMPQPGPAPRPRKARDLEAEL
jgi:hypothetical protein